MRLRAPRVNKKIFAILEEGSGIIENISASGGFLKTDDKIPKENFDIKLKVMGCRTIKINCKRQWNNEAGLGFKVLSVENSKQEFFNRYIENQIQALKIYGDHRVFTTEILITLKDTNVFGNVYFSNFIEYQGVIREKFLLASVPNLHDMLAKTQVRLVTVDTYNKYISSAYFGDTLLIELTTSDINAATCKMNITFKNKATGALIGQGYQRLCVVSSNGKVLRIPNEFLGALDFFQEVEN